MLSIIIPVYNVEAYLVRCLDSVLNQKNADFEILLVNDGATDSSGAICEDYARRDNRIHLINKENGGLSSARNAGIRQAQGEYLLFLDSDDYLVPDVLRKIQETLCNNPCDVFVGCAKTANEQGPVADKGKYAITPQRMSGKEYLKCMQRQYVQVSFCAQFLLCRRAFVEENALRFQEGILHEDELWTPILLLKAERVYYSGIYFYNHFERSGSIMHSKNHDRRVASVMKICQQLQQIYGEYPKEETTYLRDRMSMIYLSTARYVNNVREYIAPLGRAFPMKNARKLRTLCKSVLFFLMPAQYIKWLQ